MGRTTADWGCSICGALMVLWRSNIKWKQTSSGNWPTWQYTAQITQHSPYITKWKHYWSFGFRELCHRTSLKLRNSNAAKRHHESKVLRRTAIRKSCSDLEIFRCNSQPEKQMALRCSESKRNPLPLAAHIPNNDQIESFSCWDRNDYLDDHPS